MSIKSDRTQINDESDASSHLTANEFAARLNSLDGLERVMTFGRLFGFKDELDQDVLLERARKYLNLEDESDEEVYDILIYAFPIRLYQLFFPKKVTSFFNEPFAAFSEDELEESFPEQWQQLCVLSGNLLEIDQVECEIIDDDGIFKVSLEIIVNDTDFNFEYEIYNAMLNYDIFEHVNLVASQLCDSFYVIDSFTDNDYTHIAFANHTHAQYLRKLLEQF